MHKCGSGRETPSDVFSSGIFYFRVALIGNTFLCTLLGNFFTQRMTTLLLCGCWIQYRFTQISLKKRKKMWNDQPSCHGKNRVFITPVYSTFHHHKLRIDTKLSELGYHRHSRADANCFTTHAKVLQIHPEPCVHSTIHTLSYAPHGENGDTNLAESGLPSPYPSRCA